MPLVAVGEAVLRGEVRDLRVAQRERVALVVVVRVVPGERVVHLQLVAVRPALGEAEGDAVVEALRARGDRPQDAHAVGAAVEAARPGAAVLGGVGVQPAGDVDALGVVVLHEAGEVRAELPLDRQRALVGARVVEVRVEDVHVGPERRADLAGRDQVRIGGHRPQDAGERAVAEHGLAAAPVGRARRGQRQARDAPVEDAAVEAHDRLAVAGGIPRDTQPGLEHLPVRRDVAVRGKRLSLHRLPDEAVEEDLAGRGDDVGLLLALPAQAVLDGQLAAGLPLVLEEHRDAPLRDVLGAGLLDAQPAHPRLLEVQQHRPRDVRPGRTAPGLGGRPVRALHVVGVPGVVQEAVGGAEDVAAVGEADEGLHALDRVQLRSELYRVAPLHDGEVVVELDALVVVRDGDEERLAEAVAALGQARPRIVRPRGAGPGP